MVRLFFHALGWHLSTDEATFIFEAEIVPYIVALFLWRKFLKGKCLFAFIDNEGARSAWITGFVASQRRPGTCCI